MDKGTLNIIIALAKEAGAAQYAKQEHEEYSRMIESQLGQLKKENELLRDEIEKLKNKKGSE